MLWPRPFGSPDLKDTFNKPLRYLQDTFKTKKGKVEVRVGFGVRLDPSRDRPNPVVANVQCGRPRLVIFTNTFRIFFSKKHPKNP